MIKIKYLTFIYIVFNPRKDSKELHTFVFLYISQNSGARWSF